MVIYHIVVAIQADGNGGARLLQNPIAMVGFLGVPFFFVLSGFILGRLYSSPKIDVGRFYLKRFLRIYPSYFLILLGLCIVPALSFPRTLGYCFPIFALIQSWVPEWSQNLLPPSWSLSCEAFFYLVYPLIFRWILDASKARSTAIILLSFVPMALILILNRTAPVGNLVFLPLLHLPSFILGILFSSFKPIPGKVLYAVIGCGLFIILAKVLVRDAMPLKVGVAALPFAVLIWALASAKQPDAKSPLSKALIFQGNASYVLYLIHFPILIVLRRAGHLNSVTDGIVAVLVTVLAASLFYFAIDRPIHMIGTQWMDRKKSAKSAS